MSNGYVNDVRTPDGTYFSEVRYVGSNWRYRLDELGAALHAKKISDSDFWDRKKKLAEAFELGLTIAHHNFLDRCQGQDTRENVVWSHPEVKSVLEGQLAGHGSD